jgi:hypothetical protein
VAVGLTGGKTEDAMSIFGFSTETSQGGDFLPILKYDARAGRFFRVDRIDTGSGFVGESADITAQFKAVVDFDNVECGWIDFQPGSAPSFALVPMGSKLPDRPTPRHKNGVRFMVKLAKECTGPDGKAIREVAGTSKAFLSGIEAAYVEYQKFKGQNPGKLPVLTLVKTMPIKTGSGEKSSTNYHPVFAIAGWVPRGDLTPHPKANGGGQAAAQPAQVAPATGGATRAAPAQQTSLADDFG